MILTQRLASAALLCALSHVATAQVVAEFTGAPLAGTAPLTVQFTDQSTGGAPYAWSWNFGDGSSVTMQHPYNPHHKFVEPGSYSVSLTLISAGFGNFDTVQKQDFIVVEPTPFEVAFTSTHTVGDYPFAVQFSNGSTTGYSISTSF